ncbi:MAG TPA: hypothetical protein VFE58_16915 [Tepidisphaeraceae bacterium]|nr:hypothetical protein [Tepidisphaeraceae bacterium]
MANPTISISATTSAPASNQQWRDRAAGHNHKCSSAPASTTAISSASRPLLAHQNFQYVSTCQREASLDQSTLASAA